MPDSRTRFLQQALDELGLLSLYRSSRDVKLLCLQRYVRLFAYGFTTLILAAYLEALDVSKTNIGLFMTLTLVGDVFISLFLTVFADGIGRRVILGFGATLMTASGILFALVGNYWALLAAAVLGVISPSGSELGPFRAIEESVIAHLTAPEHRGDIYAWYSLLGIAGTACGVLSSGWVLHHVIQDLQWQPIPAYRLIFVGYSAMGLGKLSLAMMLSSKVEAERKQPPAEEVETSPLLVNGSSNRPERKGLRGMLPDINRENIAIVLTLGVLFWLDAFASGLAPLSWITYFFSKRHHLEEGKLGTVFFVTNIISACSMIVASSLAKRFGNVKTMVFTHLPSAIFLALIPIPAQVHWSLVFLVLRACTQSMDTAPRAAFLAAIIPPSDRTAILGIMNIVRGWGFSIGPLITGVLADSSLFWLAFVCAGSLKAVYDLGLLAMFKNHERDREVGEVSRTEERDEEEDGEEGEEERGRG